MGVGWELGLASDWIKKNLEYPSDCLCVGFFLLFFWGEGGAK